MWREWRRLPAGTLELLIEYRSYAAAYARYQHDPKATGDDVQRVKEIEFALAQGEMDAE